MHKSIDDPDIPRLLIPPEDGSIKRFLPHFKGKYSLKDTFAALNHPNYKLWFWGQMVSLFGSWMQATALAYFIYELTHSPAFLGYVGFASGIPAWIFTFYAGAVADRFERRKILIFTQSGMMFLSVLLAVLTFTNFIVPTHIIIISVFLGVMNAFDAPTRHAFVNELVGKDDLVNAIALNSTMFHTATSIGPAFGGIIYALFGPAWCFTVNAISFSAVILSLSKMKFDYLPKVKPNNSIRFEIIDGFKYLFTQKDMLVFILITTMTSLFGTGLVTLFPAWAVQILHGDSTTNGFLQSARGIGAVVFALILATINKYTSRGKLLSFTTLSFPLVLILFSFNRSLIISLLLLLFVGGFMISIYNLSNGLIQTKVSEKFRGRIMGIYSFSFLAFMPIGSLIIGVTAELFGTPLAILINSVILLAIFIGLKLYYPKLSSSK